MDRKSEKSTPLEKVLPNRDLSAVEKLQELSTRKKRKRKTSGEEELLEFFPNLKRKNTGQGHDEYASDSSSLATEKKDKILEENSDANLTPTTKRVPVQMNMFTMNYRQAVKAAKDPSRHLKAVKIAHHFIYPLSACGQIEKLMKETCDKWVGQFRSDLNGVPIVIGPIIFSNEIFVHGSQPVVHIDADICAVLFKPEEEQLYPCTVTLTENDYFVGKVYDCLSVIVKCKNNRVLPTSIKIGDELNFLYTGRMFKDGKMCQLKGVYDLSYQ